MKEFMLRDRHGRFVSTLVIASATLASSGSYADTPLPVAAPMPASMPTPAPTGEPQAAAAAEPVQGVGEAVIVFRSTKSETVLGEVIGRSFASAYGTGGSATADGVSWTNLCEGPCRYRLAPGYHELHVGAGLVAATKGFTLRPGENRIVGDRGSPGLVLGGAFLASFALIGGGLLGTFSSVPAGLAVGGAGIIGGGLMMWSGWPSLEQDRETAAPARPTGVAFRGSF